MTSGSMSGKVALVTGAASGIGRATAVVLGREGATVACSDLNSQEAEATAKEITAAGGQAFGIALDVTDMAANQQAVADILARCGGLDAVHLNAGVGRTSSILDTTIEEWRFQNSVNYDGVFFGLQAAARAMRDTGKGGSIVITSSDAGKRGSARLGAYCAGKHGVLGLMKCASVDLAPYGIRVNAVCPGVIDTPILGPAYGNAAAMTAMGKVHPIGRVGRPEEVGNTVTFLLSDASSFITGEAISVDGGLNAVFSFSGEAALQLKD